MRKGNKIIIVSAGAFALFFFLQPCFSEEWASMLTDYFEVYYRPGLALAKVERRLRSRQFHVPTGRLRPDDLSGTEEKISYRLDLLFERTKELLDMDPGYFKSDIKIFGDRAELKNEYYKIFDAHNDVVSFYVHRHNTIYTNQDDISDSVMAHEMAHAIVDRYFAVKPPEKIREMLAQYVDIHLDE